MIYTSVLFVSFICVCLYIQSEYALCCPVFVVVALATMTWMRRSSGKYRAQLIEESATSAEVFRPMAVLRMAIVDYRNMPTSFAASAGASAAPGGLGVRKPFARITYTPVPWSPADASAQSSNRELLVGCVDSSTGSSLSKLVSKLITGGGDSGDGDTLIHNVCHPWPMSAASRAALKPGRPFSHDDDDDSISFVYPILQPLSQSAGGPLTPSQASQSAGTSSAATGVAGVATHHEDGNDPHAHDAPSSGQETAKAPKSPKLVPWAENDSYVKISVYDDNPNGLIDSLIDSSWGCVRVFVRDLVALGGTTGEAWGAGPSGLSGLQPEVSGWFSLVHDRPLRKVNS